MIHTFDNGIKVFSEHLMPEQIKRYEKHNVHEKEEEEIFTDLIKKAPKNSVYIDIGSAIGYYLILAHKLRPDMKIIGYEPLKKHSDFTVQNLMLNEIDENKVLIRNKCISGNGGDVLFSNLGYGSKIATEENRHTESIKSITLEMACKHIQNVYLVQMDIQGFEKPVIESSASFIKRKTVSNYLIGTHSEKIHKSCKQVFVNCGYEILVDNYETKYQPDGILLASVHK